MGPYVPLTYPFADNRRWKHQWHKQFLFSDDHDRHWCLVPRGPVLWARHGTCANGASCQRQEWGYRSLSGWPVHLALFWRTTPTKGFAPAWDLLQGWEIGNLPDNMETVVANRDITRQFSEWGWNWQPPLSKLSLKKLWRNVIFSNSSHSNLSVTNYC